MPYELSISVGLGTGMPSATLEAILIDSSGQEIGHPVTDGFINLGNGWYIWNYDQFPDGFRGGVKFLESGQSDILAVAAINPQEVENSDVKTSSVQREIKADVGDSGGKTYSAESSSESSDSSDLEGFSISSGWKFGENYSFSSGQGDKDNFQFKSGTKEKNFNISTG